MKGRTSVVVAHRLTTVEKCDRIVVVENGHAVETGSFHELKNANGHFTELLARAE